MEHITQTILNMIENSPTAFHAVRLLKEKLETTGFQELKETASWTLQPGGRYFVIRNQSSILSFVIPEKKPSGFRLIASHSDSPCFKLKVQPEMNGAGSCIRLNTERYGGMINASWFDRPLSAAGRIIYEKDGKMERTLVDIKRDLLMIPSLAIHMNGRTNKGIEFNPQKDLIPVFAQYPGSPLSDRNPAERRAPQVSTLVAQQLGIDPGDILGGDLFVYNRMAPVFWGASGEFIASPRLDDLECCFSTFLGFLDALNGKSGSQTDEVSHVIVHAVFDNEEVGSGTAQGADSTFLEEVLERISLACGSSREEYMMQIASSFMLSADNAHAVHPNYAEMADPVNQPAMNAGVVLKHNANQKYTTDGVSGSIVLHLCRKHGIPVQHYTNRSDLPGGSTLGNIAQAHVSMKTADIGLAQLAMHSSYESAGAFDPEYLKQLSEAYYTAEDEMFFC